MDPRITTHDELLDFYRQQSPFSDPGPYASQFDGFPGELHDLCKAVQGILLHMWWIGKPHNGFTRQELVAEGRKVYAEISLPTVEERLAEVLRLDPRPLAEAREPRKRVVSNCRDYALLLVSLLRHRGTPARVRTGVARYLAPGTKHIEDHWICELWNDTTRRWQRVDAEVDDVIGRALRLPFDPLDVPEGQFLSSWECHEEVVSGRIDPGSVGFNPEPQGTAYTRYKMLQDLSTLIRHEIVPWAAWSIGGPQAGRYPDAAEATDTMARLLRSIDTPEGLQEARDQMAAHPRLRMPGGYDAGPFQKEWLAD
ncbi:MAG: transglutaminase-like domain-containing protein [Candidatus Bipolaricaulis sp.]|nr:transglutaminase-like domain-containing protein [Candidatus Bipolaricaulis sp.]